jgi:hypothetical protein
MTDKNPQINKKINKNMDGILLAVLLAAFAAVRVWASFGSLWFDEISSIGFARQLSSPLEALTKVRHDNNHILNTVYLYFVSGGGTGPVTYRLMSIFSGTASLLLMYLIGRKGGRAEAFAALWLGGVSFDFLVYSSEARGYAPAMMFALSAYYLIARSVEGGRGGYSRPVLFWLSAALGFLSHMSFIYVYLALLAWSIFDVAFNKEKEAGGAVGLVKWHGVPLVALIFIYAINTSKLVIGGGETGSIGEVVLSAVSNSIGAPEGGLWGVMGAATAALIFLAGLLTAKRRGPGERIFFFFAIAAVPALVLAVRRPEVLYVRYFIVCLPFFYILFSRVAADLSIKGRAWRLLAVAMLFVFTALSLVHAAKFLGNGRGGYESALLLMAGETPSSEIYVGSNHDLQARAMLAFYLPLIENQKRVVYLKYDDWRRDPALAPDWFVHISPEADRKTYGTINFDNGASYSLVETFGFYGPSGATWSVYRKG